MRIFYCLVALFLLEINALFAQQTLRVLFIGNSYTGVNNLPQLVADVASSAGDSLVFGSYTPGGYTLDQHFADSNVLNLIQQGSWDYIVLQEQSQLPSFPDYLSGGPFNLTHEFNEHNMCGRVMFYMTWGRKNGDASNCPLWPPVCTYQGMDSLLSLRYFEMAQLNKAEVSPVGKVWHRIRDLFPNIDLYQADESHPSEAGSYAAASCFYSALFKKDPSNITFDYTLSSTDAATIRQVAKEVVFDSLSNYSFIQNNPVGFFRYVVSGNYEVSFYNNSSGGESYLWEFGDGDTSTQFNPVHTYQGDGQYQAKLHIISCDLDSVYEYIYTSTISFCTYTPTIFPDSAILCPNSFDTLFTQTYDTYQWIGEYGDTIFGETNNLFVPTFGGEFHVITSLNNCVEMSQKAYVASYLTNMIIYNTDTSFFPDTACIGDTLLMVVYPNKPDHGIYTRQWLKDGSPLSYTGDTLMITSTGTYQVKVRNPVCQNWEIYVSDTIHVVFQNCNISVPEYENSAFLIYPQPINDVVWIKSASQADLHFDILDIFGRKMLGGNVVHGENRFDVSLLSPGTYFIQIGNIKRTLIKT